MAGGALLELLRTRRGSIEAVSGKMNANTQALQRRLFDGEAPHN